MKRKIKKVFSAFCPLLLGLLLSSCTVFDVFSVDSLIRAPKLTGDYAAVQQAFENEVGKEISLVNPLLGDFRSAYVLYDYNKDGSDETVVFYTKKEAPDEVRMHVLENKDGEWTSVCDIAGNGSEVNRIEFVDLDKDQELELAVTWNFSDSQKTKTLALYKILAPEKTSEERIAQMAVVQLTDYLVLDIDCDGQNEVFYTYITLSEDSSYYSAALFRIDPESYYRIPLSEVNISRNIAQLLGFKTDMKDALFTVYIDCLASDGRYFTELLCFDYDNNGLYRPADENGQLLADSTYRNERLLCEDVNGDYRIDIPSQSEMPGSYYQVDDETNSGTIYVTSYLQYAEGELICNARYYRNAYQNFRLRIDEFCEDVYIVFNSVTGVTQFRLRECEEEDDLLFTVYTKHGEESGYFASVTPLGEEGSFTVDRILELIDSI